MARWNSPGILVPIVLNLMVLTVVPQVFAENPPSTAVPLLVLVMAWPWFLSWIVGRVLKNHAEKIARQRDDAEDTDFI
jgi:hypothetical protein